MLEGGILSPAWRAGLPRVTPLSRLSPKGLLRGSCLPAPSVPSSLPARERTTAVAAVELSPCRLRGHQASPLLQPTLLVGDAQGTDRRLSPGEMAENSTFSVTPALPWALGSGWLPGAEGAKAIITTSPLRAGDFSSIFYVVPLYNALPRVFTIKCPSPGIS